MLELLGSNLKPSERGKLRNGGGREQHELWRRVMIYLEGLEGKEHVSPSWMGSNFDHYNKTIRKRSIMLKA